MVDFRPPGQSCQPVSQSLEAVLRDVRSAFQGQSDNRAYAASLLELYGSIISLCARAQRIRTILEVQRTSLQSGMGVMSEGGATSDELTLGSLRPYEVRQFDGFHEELLTFGRCLSAVNLAAIDIYFPGLKDDLLKVTGHDYDFSYAYVKDIAPKYGLDNRELPAVLVQILDRYSGDSGPENVGGQLMLEFGSNTERLWPTADGRFYEMSDIPTQVSTTAVLRIIELLEGCRIAIRDIVQENWKFRDLLDQRPADYGGIYVGEVEYNVSGSQVGAVGAGAHVHDVTFQQHVQSSVTGIDAGVLADQLESLLAELARRATERDHYAALVAVSDAAADAREGRTPEAVSRLSALGRWAADIASSIGLSVAVDAIKRATGLG